jgi:hypothetical protein
MPMVLAIFLILVAIRGSAIECALMDLCDQFRLELSAITLIYGQSKQREIETGVVPTNREEVKSFYFDLYDGLLQQYDMKFKILRLRQRALDDMSRERMVSAEELPETDPEFKRMRKVSLLSVSMTRFKSDKLIKDNFTYFIRPDDPILEAIWRIVRKADPGRELMNYIATSKEAPRKIYQALRNIRTKIKTLEPDQLIELEDEPHFEPSMDDNVCSSELKNGSDVLETIPLLLGAMAERIEASKLALADD